MNFLSKTRYYFRAITSYLNKACEKMKPMRFFKIFTQLKKIETV